MENKTDNYVTPWQNRCKKNILQCHLSLQFERQSQNSDKVKILSIFWTLTLLV